MKTCTRCLQTKPLGMFGKHKSAKDGIRASCKPCNNKAVKDRVDPIKNRERVNIWRKNNLDKKAATLAKRKALQKNATPPWFEKEKVALVYKKARHWGFEVDHVIPLKSKIVCGLHCWANLQLLDSKLNKSKGNKI